MIEYTRTDRINDVTTTRTWKVDGYLSDAEMLVTLIGRTINAERLADGPQSKRDRAAKVESVEKIGENHG